MAVVNVQLLLTGNELMVGDIVDSNSSLIAQELQSLGLNITRKVAVADEITHLTEEMAEMTRRADILIVNGGLGPTVDDLTADALAKLMNVELVQHPEALEHVTRWCKYRGFNLNKPNLKQTFLPKGCEVIPNSVGSAVGFRVIVNDCHVYCTPGVPVELKRMIRDEIKPNIAAYIPETQHYHVNRFQVFGIGESSLQKILDENCPDWPTDIEIGFRASMPLLELKLTTKTQAAAKYKCKWIKRLRQLLGDHIVAEIDKKPLSFPQHLQELLLKENAKITTAESCTGGLIASAITSVSGSSQVFDAGFVTYANSIKENILDVDHNVLIKDGAVSQQTVIEMAQGALKKSNAQYVIATSGIAGPGGGSEEKPVGMVWIAWGSQNQLQTVSLSLPGSRYYFQHYVTAICIDLVRRLLIKSDEKPRYVLDRALP
ncbi:CinA family nicotinamide mononucleotide deamidase-related protein [Thalassotalea atypica]|uniref:CinA family nicotinamide mononucleotide deamidase-related protein n=1 Tax=Thalassotalea atypica TaxID=2054316 RepID=UPI00257455A4|nr:CinA family nicotinamide mononucleotide deamidase-related protein [Thalassotalea atypica]